MLLLVGVGLFITSTSYSRALGAPGYASVPDKTSAWARDHHLGPVVEVVENWLYSRHHPSREAADIGQFGSAASRPASVRSIPLPALPTPVGASATPAWAPGYRDAAGHPLIYTARFEPDTNYPSVVAAAAIISRSAHAHLGLGTTQLAADDPTSLAQIPSDRLSSLIADFNSGFRFRDITGGLYFHHRTYRPLQPGQASAVIDDSGRLRIGTWGSDLHMTPTIDTVRQNLALIVDHGQVATSFDELGNRWGGALLARQYTWRSALGIDAAGNTVYVAGNQLTLSTLARAAAQAGALTAMQLDMHSGNSLLTQWVHDRATGQLYGRKLLDTMRGPATRYLTPDRRDFFYLTDAGPVAAANVRTR